MKRNIQQITQISTENHHISNDEAFERQETLYKIWKVDQLKARQIIEYHETINRKIWHIENSKPSVKENFETLMIFLFIQYLLFDLCERKGNLFIKIVQAKLLQIFCYNILLSN